MTNINVREDKSMRCYQTFSVFDGDTQIGAVQCKGVCWGVTADLKHRHGPWITFIGPDNVNSRNFGPLIDNIEDAVERVMERHHETLQAE